MTEAIMESHDILSDENLYLGRARQAQVNAQAQRRGMASLGLSEVEAVEYVLMLSRDEANARNIAEEND